MRSLLALSLICFILGSCIQPSFSGAADIEENDFAEFEEFQDEAFENTPLNEPEEDLKSEFKETEESPEPTDDFDDEVTVEVDEGDEFEGDTARSKEEPKITFAKVPHHLRPNWDSYVLELLILAGLVVYFINFFLGRAKNQKIANMWFDANRTLLEENFSLVGDDGKLDLENPGLIKEAEHLYTLWCSGRSCCEGMLVELKLLKRQDLVSTIQQMMKPKQDQIQIKVKMNDDDMDTFVMCLAKKKSATKLVKDLADLSTFCPEKKAVDKYNLPASYVLMSEIGEASTTLIDQRVVFLINKYPDLIDSIHVSDQYCGNKVPDDGAALTRLPVTEKVLILTINLSTGRDLNESIEASHTVMALVFHSVEKLKRLRLSREGKSKAEKNRQKVEEAFLKNTHALRTEAAAAKREEKRRQEKERILAEEDPDRQRRWEEKEAKKDAKRRAPKMKQMKVRA